MSTTVTLTLTDLRARNITPTAHEAVAIVLSLMDSTRARAVNHDTARFKLPSLAAIHLAADGSVSTENPAGNFSPADLATLLQQVLDDAPGVPPGLMYSMARALRAVEAPPFESTDAFVRSLTRFERGDRADVVRQLVARVENMPGPEPPPGGARIERRRTPVLVNNLRKELRAIDRRKYEETVTEVRVAALPAHMRGRPMRVVRIAIVLSIATLLACAAAADRVLAPASTPPVTAIAAPPALPIAAVAPLTAPLVSTTDATRVAANDDGPAASTAKSSGASRRGPASEKTAASKKDSHVHVVFRLGWMKHLITIHHDDL